MILYKQYYKQKIVTIVKRDRLFKQKIKQPVDPLKVDAKFSL